MNTFKYLFFLTSVLFSNLALSSTAQYQSGSWGYCLDSNGNSPFTVSGVSFSGDNKSLIINGSSLQVVRNVQILNQTKQVVIDTLAIDQRTPNQIIAKPSQNVQIFEKNIVLRVQ